MLIMDHVNEHNKAILTKNLTPEYKTNLLTPLFQFHTRNLRSATDGSLSVLKSRKTFFCGSFSASGPKLWNSLPSQIKSSPSLEIFKNQQKSILFHIKNKTYACLILIISCDVSVCSYSKILTYFKPYSMS